MALPALGALLGGAGRLGRIARIARIGRGGGGSSGGLGVRISVRSNGEEVLREFRADMKAIQTATYRALNRAIDKVATETGREIRKEYNVKQRAIRSALRKQRASRSSLTARLIVEGARLGLIEFDARWTPRMQIGASVRVKVDGGRKRVPGAFIVGSAGSRGVFRRAGKNRFPIQKLHSISVPQAFANQAVLKELEAVAVETYNKNFLQQLRYLNFK